MYYLLAAIAGGALGVIWNQYGMGFDAPGFWLSWALIAVIAFSAVFNSK